MVGHKVVGCTGCGSTNPDLCIKETKFEPLFTKEELARQFADQLRNPEVLLRDYRDITVFLWVLGAFDKQKKTLDERIVSRMEQHEIKNDDATGNAGADGSDLLSKSCDRAAAARTGDATDNFNK